MKRTIEVSTPNLRIVATINCNQRRLTTDEVDTVGGELADDLMRLAANLRWIGAPLHRVKVKPPRG